MILRRTSVQSCATIRSTRPNGVPLQPHPVNPEPTQRLRAGALLVSGFINVAGALLVLLALPGHASADRIAASWALVQFLSGVWAGVLGANTPFLHGLVAGVPALVLGFAIGSLPPQFVIVTWFLAPSAALIAAALMRFRRRRTG
jgi:hypothetical protein